MSNSNFSGVDMLKRKLPLKPGDADFIESAIHFVLNAPEIGEVPFKLDSTQSDSLLRASRGSYANGFKETVKNILQACIENDQFRVAMEGNINVWSQLCCVSRSNEGFLSFHNTSSNSKGSREDWHAVHANLAYKKFQVIRKINDSDLCQGSETLIDGAKSLIDACSIADKAQALLTTPILKPQSKHDIEAYQLRLEALKLLKEAQNIDGLEPLVFVHEHGTGQTCYMGWARPSLNEDVNQQWAESVMATAGNSFEDNRDESLFFYAGDVGLAELCGCEPNDDEVIEILNPSAGGLRP